MPPSGTTGKSSSKTGARGPTGPSGEARSSPAGNKGGAPGSSTRTASSGGMKSGPGSTGGSKTPGGSSGARNGGGSGNSSVSTGPRGPTGPKGEPRTTPAKGKAGFNLSPTTGTSFRERSKQLGAPDAVESYNPNAPMGLNKVAGAAGMVRDRLARGAELMAESVRQRINPVARNDFNQYVSRSLPNASLSGSLRGDNTLVSMPNTDPSSVRPRPGPRPSVASGKGDLGGAGTTPAGGKGDLGGYRGGGLATSRRSYKIK